MRRRAAGLLASAALAVAGGAALTAAPAAARDLTPLVHPLSGSLGAGFPAVGPTLPFGLLQLGPDTGVPGGEDPVTYVGYGYQDPLIRDFSLTHFDGAGIHIGGDLPFMPTTGAVPSATDPTSYASEYSHAGEQARPGYYSVDLARYDTRVELTSAARAGMARITFPSTAQANVLFPASHSIGVTHPAGIEVDGDRTVSGWGRSDVGYTVFFRATFDRPFASFGTWHAGAPKPGTRTASGSDDGAWVTFDATSDRTVTMRVAISYVDAAGAARNLAAEAPRSESFAAMRRAAHDAWDARLHDAVVTGGDPGTQATFYTNLYRSFLLPSVFDDADGRYLGFDGAVHRVAPWHHHYTDLSLWDTYRTQEPLLELLEPGVARDVALSLMADADQGGGSVPRWVQAARDRGIMGGDSGTATLADAVVQGLVTGPAAQHAHDLMWRQATALPPAWPREHLDGYLARGWVGYDESDIGVALTQEYSIDDAALLGVARRYGTPGEVGQLQRRLDSWRNLVDPGSRFIRPRDRDGTWANPTQAGPLTVPWSPLLQDGYQEATGWQALWSEPQDVAGLVSAIGGRDAALSRLDRFFTSALNRPLAPVVPLAQQQASLFGVYYAGDQYTPANEPDLWAPWYYDWLGEPDKAAQVVRAEMATYNSGPFGLPGNDDAGTMSAWYVLAGLGIYRAAPGVPAWELASPAFASATLRVRGHRLVLAAPGASGARPYVEALSVDGRAYGRTWLPTATLLGARRLDYALGATPSPTWGRAPGAAPPSL